MRPRRGSEEAPQRLRRGAKVLKLVVTYRGALSTVAFPTVTAGLPTKVLDWAVYEQFQVKKTYFFGNLGFLGSGTLRFGFSTKNNRHRWYSQVCT